MMMMMILIGTSRGEVLRFPSQRHDENSPMYLGLYIYLKTSVLVDMHCHIYAVSILSMGCT